MCEWIHSSTSSTGTERARTLISLSANATSVNPHRSRNRENSPPSYSLPLDELIPPQPRGPPYQWPWTEQWMDGHLPVCRLVSNRSRALHCLICLFSGLSSSRLGGVQKYTGWWNRDKLTSETGSVMVQLKAPPYILHVFANYKPPRTE